MQKEEFKKVLLNIGYFKNNKYLDKYVDFIFNQNNIENTKIKFITEEHHVIPVSYYKKLYSCSTREEALYYADKDINNWKINLNYINHIKCHILLFKCTCNYLKISMSFALEYMSGIYKNEGLDYISKLNDEELKLLQKANYFARNQTSIKHKNKKLINNGIEEKWLYNDEVLTLNNYLNNGWKEGRLLKKVYIIKNDDYKIIEPSYLDKYLEEGWIKDIPQSWKDSHKSLITIHKDDEEKHVKADVLDDYLNDGWEKGRPDKFKKINSENKKGQIDITNIHNQHKRIKPEELDYFEKQGWWKGMPNNIRTIIVVKDDVEIKIRKEDLKYYINELGYKKGYSSRHYEHIRNGCHKGHQAWNKGIPCSEVSKQKRKTTIQNKYPEGLRYNHSNEAKKKISLSHKGKITVSKDKVIKYIDKKDLNIYLDKGWIKGRKG